MVGTLRSWIVALAWGIGSVGHAGEVDPVREAELALSLRGEEAALDGLVAVLKAEVREGRLRISDRAKIAWQLGAKGFDEVLRVVDRGEVDHALRSAGPVRARMQDGAFEAFSVQRSDPIHRAIKGCVDALAPRLESVRHAVEARHDEALDVRWRHAKATFESAKRLAAVGDYGNAWPTLVSAADQMDRLALDVVYGASEAEPTPSQP